MFKIFMDSAKYLESQGIILPVWLFWIILICTIIAILITGYQKYIKPIIKKQRDLEAKINMVDSMEQKIEEVKTIQDKAIAKSIAADEELNQELIEINEKIDKVTKMFVSKQISDMRYEILDFGSAVMNGRIYDKEAYDHILDIYDDYENILKENDMTNGRVTTTMNIIKDAYKNNFLQQIIYN